MRYKIERGVKPSHRGPRQRFTDLPLAELQPDDSIVIGNISMKCRPSTYNSVKKVVNSIIGSGKVKGEFKVSTRTLGNDTCEVRVFRER